MTTHPGSSSALAAVAKPCCSSEVQRLPVGECPADAGWLRVDASGICGTDVSLHAGGLQEECILGHHVVGQIAALGEQAAPHWNVALGDRVAVEEYLPCGSCANCRRGRYRMCPTTDLWKGGRRIGLLPVSERPSLWGGNAEFMYLPANAVLHPLPPELSVTAAAWTLPLANALDWSLGAGGLEPQETAVILGPGYHGLAAAAVAKHFGAGQVIVCGLERDHARLELARHLGAVPIQVADTELPSAVADLTGGAMADVVLDLTPSGDGGLRHRTAMLSQHGRLVLATAKAPPIAEVDTAELIERAVTVRAVRGRAPERVRQSIELLTDGGCGLEAIPTAEVSLAEVGPMLSRLAAGDGPDTPHVVVRPWLPA